MSLKRLGTLYAVSCLSVVSAHTQMIWPYPLRNLLSPKGSSELKDYNMIGPLQPSGDDYACKGYQYNTPWHSTAWYYPGETYNISIAGGATHGGGSCQISLSYDSGVTFNVIKSIIGGCAIEKNYEFTIPSAVPTGQALLAWTWFNHEGNREMYMNCAVVDIIGNRRLKSKREANEALARLPNIYVANLAGINSCKTVEMEDVVLPDPGKDVKYAGGMSSASTASSERGQCDGSGKAATVGGRTGNQDAPQPVEKGKGAIRHPDDSPEPQPTIMTLGVSCSTESSVVQDLPSPPIEESITPEAALPTTAIHTPAELLPIETPTVTSAPISIEDPTAVTLADEFLDSEESTLVHSVVGDGFPAEDPVPDDFTGDELGPDGLMREAEPPLRPFGPLHECVQLPDVTKYVDPPPEWRPTGKPGASLQTPPRRPPTRTTMTTRGRITVLAPVQLPVQSPIQDYIQSCNQRLLQPRGPIRPPLRPDCDISNLPFATGDPSSYLPCHPGTFLCISPSSYLTCIQVSSSWAYGAPRDVAAGMICQPFLVLNGSARVITRPNPRATRIPPLPNPDDPQAIDWSHAMAPGPVIPEGVEVSGGISVGGGGGRQCPVVVPGYYRDDKYVAASTSAGGQSCRPGRSYKCNGPDGFSLCNWGKWVDMGKVAAGTKCVDGKIVAA